MSASADTLFVFCYYDSMDIVRPAPQQKRPADAKLVFKGVIFDAYQWQQKMFDGSEKTFEVLTRPDTAIVIPVTKDGCILVINEQQPGQELRVDFPGGRIDVGEKPDQAALRELREETGYTAKDIVLWRAWHPQQKLDWVVYVFIARGCEKEADQHLDAGEKITMQEVGFDKTLELAREGAFAGGLAGDAYRAALEPAYYQELKKLFGLA